MVFVSPKTIPPNPEVGGTTGRLDFRMIVEALPCLISIQDAGLRVLYANRAFRNAFGEPEGQKCHFLYKGLNDRCPNCPAGRSMDDRQVHSGEQTVRRTDGSISQLLMHTVPFTWGAAMAEGILEIATDITRSKKAHKELVILGQSIAFLSHAVKNILEGLQGGVYVVDEALTETNVKLACKGWGIVKRNIFDITDAVQNILYSSKQRELRYETADPGSLAENAVVLFRHNASSMGVDLCCETRPEVGAARLDPPAIRRMLNNLIWNAVQACHKDEGKPVHAVTVRTRTHDAAHFRYEIEDNGPGIEPGKLKHIFEEFYSTKASSGTGLGLAVVDRIVNQHGGRIEVESTPGCGSIFRIILNY